MWRYSPINELDLSRFAPASADADGTARGQAFVDQVTASLGPVAGHVLVHNGRPVAFGTTTDQAGLQFGGADDVPGAEAMLGAVLVGGDALVRLNDASVPDAVFVDVAPGGVVVDPILVVHWSDGGAPADHAPAAFPRTCIRVGDGGAASVIELYAGPAGTAPALTVPVTELSAGDGASLAYVSLQILNDAAWSIARLAARGGTDAVIRTFTVGLGGAYDRVRTDVSVDGPGAKSEILSAYLGSGTQVHDIRTLQDHVAPKTRSELLCLGAVAGTSHSVYSGLIRVHRGAVRTDARQTNHNLVLDEGAHADSVPNLDILENDVKCSHGSTVGPIDEDQRYYLESRGIAPDVAEGLIVRGFYDDIIDRGPVPAVAPLLRREVHTRLDRVFADRRVTADA